MSPPKASSCCLRYLAPPLRFWTGSRTLVTPRPAAVAGISCVRPRAPAGEPASALKPDSCLTRPASSAGSRPLAFAAAVISAAYGVPAGSSDVPVAVAVVAAVAGGGDRARGGGSERAALRGRQLGREARAGRLRLLRGRRACARRQHRLDLVHAAHDRLDAHAETTPRRWTAAASSSSRFWFLRAHSALWSACWRSLSLSMAWRSRAAEARKPRLTSTSSSRRESSIAALVLQLLGALHVGLDGAQVHGGRQPAADHRVRFKVARGADVGPRFVEQHPALVADDESLRECLPRLFFSALSEGPDPLEPEREGGCLHVGGIGTWGLDLKSASGLLAETSTVEGRVHLAEFALFAGSVVDAAGGLAVTARAAVTGAAAAPPGLVAASGADGGDGRPTADIAPRDLARLPERPERFRLPPDQQFGCLGLGGPCWDVAGAGSRPVGVGARRSSRGAAKWRRCWTRSSWSGCLRRPPPAGWDTAFSGTADSIRVPPGWAVRRVAGAAGRRPAARAVPAREPRRLRDPARARAPARAGLGRVCARTTGVRRPPPGGAGLPRLPGLVPCLRARGRERAMMWRGRRSPRARPASPRSGESRVGAVQDAVAGRLRMGRPLSRRGEPALVRAAQAGSADAVDELFRRHWPAAHRAAWLVVHDAAAAEDIAQEAFLAALRALDRFDRRRPLGPWLHRIVVNRAIDWSRARALRPEAGDAVPDAPALDEDGGLGEDVVAALADARPRAPRGGRPPAPARLHAGRDRGDARPPARHRQLPPAPRARRARRRVGGAMNELERALREAEVPDAVAARERARQTVLAARTGRCGGAAPARTRVGGVACGLAAVVFSARDTGPARALERSCATSFAAPTPAPTPAPTSLPGRLLVLDAARCTSSAAASARGSAPGDDATWSPRGLFVGVAAGDTLAAVEPGDGTVRWRCAARRRCSSRAGPRRRCTSRTAPAATCGSSTATASTTCSRAATWPRSHRRGDRTSRARSRGRPKDGAVTVEDADTAKVLWTAPGRPGPPPRVVGRRPPAARRRPCATGRSTTSPAASAARLGVPGEDRRRGVRAPARARRRSTRPHHRHHRRADRAHGAGPVARPRVVTRRATAARGLAGRRPLARRAG